MMSPRPAARWVGQVVVWALIGAVAVAVVLAVLVPRVAGATPYTILTGSMQPTFPPGTLVVVKPVEADEVRAGDVITYQLESGRAPVVTHRVTAVHHTVGGDTTFTTQGDANDVADAEPVSPVQIRGRLWYAVPYLGHVDHALTGPQRKTATYVVAGALVLYAGWMFAGALRDRRTAGTTRITK